MSNEPIRPIEQNYVPYETLFPNAVIGGVEVDDNISSVTKTWSSSKINTEIDSVSSNIDLSDYQLKSEKNIAGGYLGLDADGRILDYFRLKPKNRYSYNENSSLLAPSTSVATGGGLSTNTLNTESPALRSGNSTRINTYAIAILANQSGSSCAAIGSSSYNFIRKIYLGASGVIYSQVKVSLAAITSSDKIIISVGKVELINSSGTISGTDGYFFFKNPAVNSDKWTCNVINAGVTTTYNTNIAVELNQEIIFSTTYNKATGELKFYINNILQTTMNSILPDALEYIQLMSLCTAVTNQPKKIVGLIDSVFELEV